MLGRIARGASRRMGALDTRIRHHIKQARRRLVALDETRILNTLKTFGAFNSNILLVHSSLSACGQIRGGAQTVVEAIHGWIRDRTLAMPTHTYCYPDNSRGTPIFDVESTSSLVGAITDYFWRQPNVIRSVHPTHSLAASGPGSEKLCQGHELSDTPCGEGTPYERLVEQNCSVLMFGATMNTYTLFHTAEDAAKIPSLYEAKPYNLCVMGRDGSVRQVVMWRHDMSVSRRFESMDTWLEERGLLVRRRLGRGELLFIPRAGDLHEWVVEELRRDPLFLVAEDARTDVAKRFGL